jgi:hypothetical protein
MKLGKAIRVGWVGLALTACGPREERTGESRPSSPCCDEDDDTGVPIDFDRDGWTEAGGDCNDDEPDVHPGAPERCNRVDDDCDGLIDDDDPDFPQELLSDDDGDGYRGTADDACGDDCDDADATVHPGAPDAACDGVDSNCASGGTDVATLDGVTGLGLPEAFALAGPGAEILVCPGTHSIGAVEVNDFEGTIRPLSGSREDTALVWGSVSGGGDLEMRDLSLDTMLLRWTGPLTVERSLFTASSIYVEYSGTADTEPGVVVRNSTFLDMPFSRGACPVDATIFGGSILVEETEFHDNEVDGAFCSGGLSLHLSDATAVVSSSLFEHNYSSGPGAAIAVSAGDGANLLRLTGSTLHSNESVVSGGVLVANSWGGATLDVDIESSTFDGNSDGAMRATAGSGSTVVITDSSFTNNFGMVTAAGVQFHGADGANTSLRILGSYFDGNMSSSEGACAQLAVYADASAVEIADTTFRGSETRIASGGSGCTVGFWGSDTTISWSGGAVGGNEQYFLYTDPDPDGAPLPEWRYGGWGAVFLGLDWGNTASFDNVEFGTDADGNEPFDIWECSSNPHVGTITADLDAANPCP